MLNATCPTARRLRPKPRPCWATTAIASGSGNSYGRRSASRTGVSAGLAARGDVAPSLPTNLRSVPGEGPGGNRRGGLFPGLPGLLVSRCGRRLAPGRLQNQPGHRPHAPIGGRGLRITDVSLCPDRRASVRSHAGGSGTLFSPHRAGTSIYLDGCLRQELAGQVSQAVRNSQAVPPTASPTRPIAHASDPLAS